MTDVTRYDATPEGDMVSDTEGDFVTYDEYHFLHKRYTKLTKELKELKGLKRTQVDHIIKKDALITKVERVIETIAMMEKSVQN